MEGRGGGGGVRGRRLEGWKRGCSEGWKRGCSEGWKRGCSEGWRGVRGDVVRIELDGMGRVGW